jgi:hypothetical protein
LRHHRWTTAEIVEAYNRLPTDPFLTRTFFDISYQLTGDSWHSDSLRRALLNSGFIMRAGRKNRKLVLWQKIVAETINTSTEAQPVAATSTPEEAAQLVTVTSGATE